MRKTVSLHRDMLSDSEIWFFDKMVKDWEIPPSFLLAHMVKHFMRVGVNWVPNEIQGEIPLKKITD